VTRWAARPVRLAAVSKYRAVRTTVDGVTFASQREAARYGVLRLLERAGAICHLRLQPRYPLWVRPIREGPPVYIGTWIGDFEYDRPTGGTVVEDVKGVRTPVYKLKKRLVEALYGIQIVEVA